ncbi:MAG: VOC family protein [Propionibacteriales bacterium]|nr:VOC family protein [Propionibacteriales bacterium]
MAINFQLTIDCTDPDRLVSFWAAALGYRPEDPPEGYATWRAYWLHVGVPAEELGAGDCNDSLVDPDGIGPRIVFLPVPEGKTVKNRLHLDLKVGGGREVPLETRRHRVDARVDQLVAAGAKRALVFDEPDANHYHVLMHDPEGNEFDVV